MKEVIGIHSGNDKEKETKDKLGKLPDDKVGVEGERVMLSSLDSVALWCIL